MNDIVIKKILFSSVLFSSVLLVLAACNQADPEKQQTEALKTSQSWIATARMVGETWQEGYVPDQYAQQTLSKSQQEIARQIKISAPNLSQQLHQVQQTLQEMTLAVEQKDKQAIAPPLQKLSNEQLQLQDLASSNSPSDSQTSNSQTQEQQP